MNWITNIIEPNSLILAWQPHAYIDESRKRRAVGIIEKKENSIFTFRYLANSDDYLKARELGFDYLLPFDNENMLYKHDVIETFSKRLPSRKRNDFQVYLKSIRIRPSEKISDFSLLAYSEAQMYGDNFSIVNTFEGVDQPCQFLLEIAGFRYHRGMELDLNIGDAVEFILDPTNLFDQYAIKICAQNETIGFVNRLLLPAFHRWMKGKTVTAVIEKMLNSDDRPKVLLFVMVNDL